MAVLAREAQPDFPSPMCNTRPSPAAGTQQPPPPPPPSSSPSLHTTSNDGSQSLLLALFVSEPATKDPIKSSQAATSPRKVPSHPHIYANAQSSDSPESATRPPLPPSVTPARFASRLTHRNPFDVSGQSQERSPYLKNMYYLHATNDASRSAGLGSPCRANHFTHFLVLASSQRDPARGTSSTKSL
ncbi:hypothetical protein PCANC_03618 [Puccinia coronata f. sp. avenae]|uniref:Uncharacterized protein n=1 Tax=Puccinia coronata f. sp. avenae TaxID=200324 RepID=A0A2N5VV09_9BASI|nr:hypothetical protein PCANC_03618 [Puccinia coronata f. sp. avenae]